MKIKNDKVIIYGGKLFNWPVKIGIKHKKILEKMLLVKEMFPKTSFSKIVEIREFWVDILDHYYKPVYL